MEWDGKTRLLVWRFSVVQSEYYSTHALDVNHANVSMVNVVFHQSFIACTTSAGDLFVWSQTSQNASGVIPLNSILISSSVCFT